MRWASSTRSSPTSASSVAARRAAVPRGASCARAAAALAPRARLRRGADARARRERVRLIAEVKRPRPSAGVLAAGFDPVAQAPRLRRGGAAAISVLTDASTSRAASTTWTRCGPPSTVPLLRKEFIVDEYQLWEARAARRRRRAADRGRSSTPARLARPAPGRQGRSGSSTLVEVHTAAELDRAPRSSGAGVIGVNNRDLHDARAPSLETTLAPRCPRIPPAPCVGERERHRHAAPTSCGSSRPAPTPCSSGEALVRSGRRPAGEGPRAARGHELTCASRSAGSPTSRTRCWASRPAPTRSGFIFVEGTPRYVTPGGGRRDRGGAAAVRDARWASSGTTPPATSKAVAERVRARRAAVPRRRAARGRSRRRRCPCIKTIKVRGRRATSARASTGYKRAPRSSSTRPARWSEGEARAPISWTLAARRRRRRRPRDPLRRASRPRTWARPSASRGPTAST